MAKLNNIDPILCARPFLFYLNQLVTHFESPSFIADDPIRLCHSFTDPSDQEIIGLYAATLAWGSRGVILAKLEELCTRMEFRPWRFVMNFDSVRDGDALRTFVHRTFQPEDCLAFTQNLSILIRQFGSVENIFGCKPQETDLYFAIERFSTRMMTAHPDTPARLQKHLARPSRGSACKRLSLYLRWMVRPGPVDLGLWKSVQPRQLVLPLDIHSGRQARILGLLNRNMNDWKAVMELTEACRNLDRNDPARYDYALFGLGAYGDPFTDP